MTGPYLFIRNFQRFLHYSNRKPVWLRLHTAAKQDWSDLGLKDAQRGQLVSLVLTAAERGNMLPTDPAELRELAGISGELALGWLIDKGFLGCSEPALLPELGKLRAKPQPVKAVIDEEVPQQQIIDLYHSVCPDLPKVKAWHRQRQQLLAARWREDEKRQSLDYWGKFFAAVKQSDFLYGHATDFRASLEWLLRPTNFAKVIEGNYHGAKKD